MTFEAQMRVGSVEIAAALFAVAIFAARPRVRVAADVGRLQPMRVALDVLERGARRSYEGRPPFEVGRASGNDLVLADPEVSRSHARFDARNGVVYVGDLRSSNGTYLNGRRVSEAIEIRAGDRIDVGTTRLVVRECAPWT
ncbi:MAG TPA: FHA domain-containing protein [Verrucomicrobiae bacterium]|nr:FHA domain-containing protein [Verrucomicrobiae bacterium]